MNEASDPIGRDRMANGGIYFVTSKNYGMGHVEAAKVALEGGVKIVQYREKEADLRTMVEEATKIKALCRQHGAILIVNDSLDVAKKVNPDGVHVGQDDAPLEAARKMFPDKIIGVSADTAQQAIKAEQNGATYVGVTVFSSRTKKDAVGLGLDGFRAIRKSTSIPVYGIGGLKLEHIEEIKKCGGDGIAVISAILDAQRPVDAARQLVGAWNGSQI
jgi:thiamine-phosphate pyrophosphorylase